MVYEQNMKMTSEKLPKRKIQGRKNKAQCDNVRYILKIIHFHDFSKQITKSFYNHRNIT